MSSKALATTQEDFVTAAITYNPFDLSDIEKVELEYREGLSLFDYVHDLPTEVEWSLGVNGIPAANDNYKNIPISSGDVISIVQIPQGDGAKDILRMVAMAVVMVAAIITQQYYGVYWAAAVSVGGALAINFLLPPSVPSFGDTNDVAATQSYGYDGAKNSAKEGVPVPVVYGEYRVAGNFVDVYTVNSGDDQVMYLRSILNDGSIEGIYDVELNEQPITNYNSVYQSTSLGDENEPIHPWFTSSIRLENKGIKLSQSATFTKHITNEPVDQVRFDIVFPKGLVSIEKETGNNTSRGVTFQAEYRLVGDIDWLPLYIEREVSFGAVSVTPSAVTKITVDVVNSGNAIDVEPNLVNYSINYRKSGDTVWTPLGSFSDNIKASVSNSAGGWDGNYVSTWRHDRSYSVAVPEGVYEIQFTTTTGATATVKGNVSSSNQTTITASSTSSKRYTLECSAFPVKGNYEVAIRRVSPDSTSKYIQDESWLTDVGEIETDPVAMRGSAWLGIKAKMTDQLSNIPQVTARVRGSILQEYDELGNNTVLQWSANPAWITLDILIGTLRGIGVDKARIDFADFVEWAQYCDLNNITFNGVFDRRMNAWDAMMHLFRISHAAPVKNGTRIGVSIDTIATPVMLIGAGSIIQDTMSTTYIGVEDRANEFEVHYFDREDRNKQKTIRIVDPKQYEQGEKQKIATLTLPGIDNADQANREAWRQAYMNRYLIRTLQFDMPLEAIGLTIGDVALIAHPMMTYNYSGRLKAGSTTSVLRLDRPVIMEVAKSYKALVHYPSIKRYTGTITGVISNVVTVTGLPAAIDKNIMRMTKTGSDVEIVSATGGASFATIKVTDATAFSVTDVVEFWENDAIEEAAVTLNVGAVEQISLSAALPEAPGQYATWTFGEVSLVKRPFRLRGVSGDGLEQRTVKFIEYNENVYAGPEQPYIQPPVSDNGVIPSHVVGLSVSYDVEATAATDVIRVLLTWQSGDTLNYGGADVYMKSKGLDWIPAGTVQNTKSIMITVNRDETVEFKVIAFNGKNIRANFNDAPVVVYDFTSTAFLPIDPPTNVYMGVISYKPDVHAQVTWTASASTYVLNYEVQYKLQTETEWLPGGFTDSLELRLSPLVKGNYDVRVRAVGKNTVSTWDVGARIISSPTMAAMSGLTVDAQALKDQASYVFTGKDVDFTWSEAGITDPTARDLYFSHYKVEILTTLDAVLRTEETVENSYRYTLAKNKADLAGNAFKFRVSRVGRDGQTSATIQTSLSNAAPAAPTAFGTKTDTTISLVMASNAVDDGDFSHFEAICNGVTLTGADTNITFGNLAATTLYPITVYAYDEFGGKSPAWSGNVTTTAGASSAWGDITGAGKPEDNATVGADYDTNLTNSPVSDGALNKDSSFSGITGAWHTNYVIGAPEITTDAECVFATEVTSPAKGNTILRATSANDGGNQVFSDQVPFDPTKTYKVHAWVRQPSGTKRNYLLVGFLDSAGAAINNSSTPISDATGWAGIGSHHYYGASNIAFPSAWTYYEVVIGPNQAVKAPTGAVTAYVGALMLRDVYTPSVVEFASMGIEEVNPNLWSSIIDDDGTAPAPNADVTANNTSADTAKVNNVAASTIATAAAIASAGLDASGNVKRTVPTQYIPSITIDKLISGNLGAIIELTGASRLNYRLGGYIKKVGLGFGSSNQFLEWYGPDIAENLMTEANAIMYLKTDGSAYFGGSLSAGTLKTSASTSDLSATAEIAIGPYGTNGGPKQIVASHTLSGTQTTGAYPSGTVTSDTTTAFGSVNLYVDEWYLGAWVQRATIVVTGSKRVINTNDAELGVGSRTTWSISGSTTYTDNRVGTDDRTYRARITGGDALGVPAAQQRVSIISTE